MPQPASLAIVSTACRFPDAVSPARLWDNIVEGRRSFRAMPRERLDLARYAAALIGEADSITPIRAGLLTNWQPDASRLRIPGRTLAATDLTHWLALDIATDAFAAIGGAQRLDRTRTAVVVANTLTGEFSRAALLRLRLPFLDDVLTEAASREGLENDALTRLRGSFAALLRRHFPDPNEDSLAGGLANTIAGRIANHFDLRGGAYSVDGACASSLVAVADAGNLIATGQADAVLVAAVDLSLDPFEMVGFSRNGALASGEMRVFDARSNGFWPGEGGGAVLLMRGDEAARRDLPAMAHLRGWGMSSDGAGGLTRPSSDGQLMAYRRAYDMARIDPADIAFVEAHGTGTAIGDPTEVRALAVLRDGARRPLPIGSIKANIGHTKAAAGLAGLIKTIAALKAGIVPPHMGCETPHDVFAETDGRIHPALAGETIGDGRAIAGVSSFGFGGINAHVVLEGAVKITLPITPPARPPLQDAELFVFAGNEAAGVIGALERLEARAPGLSMAELTDAAAYACETMPPGALRVAVVASSGTELAARLVQAKAALAKGDTMNNANGGVFVSHASTAPRIAFLFPGQAAPSRPDGGAWTRRFAELGDLSSRLPAGADPVATDFAQPAIAAASLAALRVMDRLGINATIAAGHSLGEIVALAHAGALDAAGALELARIRGALMAEHAMPGGAMLRVALPLADAQRLAAGHDAVVACHNADNEIVLSGSRASIESVTATCRAHGIEATPLSVSHAFHSPHMAPATEVWRAALGNREFAPPQRRVVSTVTGAPLTASSDIKDLLVRQLTAPVAFAAALDHIAGEADIVIEVGPGQGLTRLARLRGLAAYSVDAYGPSMMPLLSALAALFVAGANPNLAVLFADCRTRPFDPAAVPLFLASPCAPRRPADDTATLAPTLAPTPAEPVLAASSLADDAEPLALVRRAIAEETQFAEDGFADTDRFLDHLHLNSLSVARIVARAARLMAIEPPRAATDFANATARELADALAEMRALGPATRQRDTIAGVRPWLRRYAMQWEEAPAPARPSDIAWGDNLVWLPDGANDECLPALLTACQALWRDKTMRHLAICHDGLALSAFARSLALEHRFDSVQIVQRSRGQTKAEVLPLLAIPLDGFHEFVLAEDGKRLTPRFQPLTAAADPARAINASDVVAVTGGASGIGAECALRLAACTGAAIAMIGRRAADDDTVRAILDRAAQAGLRCVYRTADVTDADTLRDAFASVEREFGSVTVLMHAAGRNEPRAFAHLTADELAQTLAPKVQGLRHALAAVPNLRRVIAFGSIIGRLGLEGEAHYALANALAADIVARWADTHDGARGLTIEWSAWSGLGMGERLGTIERLADRGVAALSVDDALDEFERLIRDDAQGTIAVCGRFGDSRHAGTDAVQLPALRFVGQPLIYYPGCELVVETSLSPGRDLYLADHRVDHRILLPGVMGLEAMAQVAAALSGQDTPAVVEDVAFENAITVADHEPLAIRIAALLREDGRVEAVIRAADDDFATTRMRAVFAFGPLPAADKTTMPGARDVVSGAALYGPLLFQTGRFRRIAAYRHIAARRIEARLSHNDAPWFSTYEAQRLVLGDPGLHDAMLHALQAAVPHQRVLPVAIDRIERFAGGVPATVQGIERSATDREFVFDIEAFDAHGACVERWRGVAFRAIGALDIEMALATASYLAAPYLERLARAAFTDHSIEVAFIADAKVTRGERRRAALDALGLAHAPSRSDGKPLTGDASGLSLAHQGDITLAVKAKGAIACDLAAMADFGADTSERNVAAAARLWAVQEVARKLSRPAVPSPKPAYDPHLHCVSFESPSARTVTWCIRCGAKEVIAAIGVARPHLSRALRPSPPAADASLEAGALP
jgi:enediyne polyketide synthase